MADNSLSLFERIRSGISRAAEYFTPRPRDRLQDTATSKFPDFFWDLITSYVATAVFGLAGLDIASSLLRGSMHCFVPGEPTIRQNDFINEYCRHQVPPTYYVPLFLFVEGILLGSVHYVWKTVHYGKFYTFLRQATSMDRHKDSKTGEYSTDTTNIVRNLERTFKRSQIIYLTYIAKVVLQLSVVIGGILISAWVFKVDQFHTRFNCSFESSSREIDALAWLDSSKISCSLPVLRSHLAAWIINYVLLSVAVFSCLYGLVWSLWVHTARLNYSEAALYSLLSGIHHIHVYHKWRSIKWLKVLFVRKFCICNDFNFMFLKLARLDSGHGTVMKDVLVSIKMQNKLQELNEQLNFIATEGDSQLKSAFKKDVRKEVLNQQGSKDIPTTCNCPSNVSKNILEVIEDILANYQEMTRRTQDFFAEHNGQELVAFDLSIGMPGFSMFIPLLDLKRPFDTVVSFNFDPDYQNSKVPVLYQDFTSNRFNIRTQPDIFTSDLSSIRKKLDEEALKKCLVYSEHSENNGEAIQKKKKANLIIVGPFTDEDRRMTVHWFLSLMIYSEFIAEEAMLIIFNPLEVDGKSVKGTFVDYWPTVPWYQAPLLEYTVDCGGIEVKFKVSVYLHKPI